jgi:hypothetical protein
MSRHAVNVSDHRADDRRQWIKLVSTIDFSKGFLRLPQSSQFVPRTIGGPWHRWGRVRKLS